MLTELFEHAYSSGSRGIGCGTGDYLIDDPAMVLAYTDCVVQQDFGFRQTLSRIIEQICLVFRLEGYEHRIKFVVDIAVICRRIDSINELRISILDLVKIGDCGTQPPLGRFGLNCALLWECNETTNFVEIQVWNALEAIRRRIRVLNVFSEGLKCLLPRGAQIDNGTGRSHGCGSGLPNRAFELWDRAGRRKIRSGDFIIFLLSTLIFGNPQGDASRSKRANRNQCIDWYADCRPKILRLDVRPKYRDGDASDCQIANHDQQCDERDVSDSPCSFHRFPVTFFRGKIVARAGGRA